MARESLVSRVRTGMEVRTADGQSLGKVTEVWLGTDPTASQPLCDEELCSRLEVRSGSFFKRTTLYVPYSAIADVTADHVMLNVDAATAHARPWTTQPSWGTR